MRIGPRLENARFPFYCQEVKKKKKRTLKESLFERRIEKKVCVEMKYKLCYTCVQVHERKTETTDQNRIYSAHFEHAVIRKATWVDNKTNGGVYREE